MRLASKLNQTRRDVYKLRKEKERGSSSLQIFLHGKALRPTRRLPAILGGRVVRLAPDAVLVVRVEPIRAVE